MTQNTAKAWPARFGTITDIAVKSGRRGKYAIVTMDCKKFTQVAYAFGDKLVDQVISAGKGSNAWFKGPIEQVDRGTHSEDQMKIVYFADKSKKDEAPAAEAAEATASEDTAAEMVSAAEDDMEIPF